MPHYSRRVHNRRKENVMKIAVLKKGDRVLAVDPFGKGALIERMREGKLTQMWVKDFDGQPGSVNIVEEQSLLTRFLNWLRL